MTSERDVEKRPLSTDECAAVLKAMSDRTRLQILKVLFKGEKCGTELAIELNSSQPHIAHHLNILKKANLVDSHRDGKRVCYRLHRAVYEAMRGEDRRTIDLGCCTMTFKDE